MKENRSNRIQCHMSLFPYQAALLNMNHLFPWMSFSFNRNEGCSCSIVSRFCTSYFARSITRGDHQFPSSFSFKARQDRLGLQQQKSLLDAKQRIHQTYWHRPNPNFEKPLILSLVPLLEMGERQLMSGPCCGITLWTRLPTLLLFCNWEFDEQINHS